MPSQLSSKRCSRSHFMSMLILFYFSNLFCFVLSSDRPFHTQKHKSTHESILNGFCSSNSRLVTPPPPLPYSDLYDIIEQPACVTSFQLRANAPIAVIPRFYAHLLPKLPEILSMKFLYLFIFFCFFNYTTCPAILVFTAFPSWARTSL